MRVTCGINNLQGISFSCRRAQNSHEHIWQKNGGTEDRRNQPTLPEEFRRQEFSKHFLKNLEAYKSEREFLQSLTFKSGEKTIRS